MSSRNSLCPNVGASAGGLYNGGRRFSNRETWRAIFLGKANQAGGFLDFRSPRRIQRYHQTSSNRGGSFTTASPPGRIRLQAGRRAAVHHCSTDRQPRNASSQPSHGVRPGAITTRSFSTRSSTVSRKPHCSRTGLGIRMPRELPMRTNSTFMGDLVSTLKSLKHSLASVTLVQAGSYAFFSAAWRMASKTPLTNSTESAEEKRRASSSASLMTTAGGVAA